MTTTTSPSSVPGEWDRSLSARAERYAAGKALRARVPRTSHAEWAPDPERPDPISLLEASNSTRLEHLVPIRYGRMAMSPFAFLRGSAAVMASDLAKTPVSGIQAQLCGDARLCLTGAQAGLRCQRLRRNARRSLGMGSEAIGDQRDRSRPAEWLHRPGEQAGRSEVHAKLP